LYCFWHDDFIHIKPQREKLIKRRVVTRRWLGLLMQAMRASALDVHQLAGAACGNYFNY